MDINHKPTLAVYFGGDRLTRMPSDPLGKLNYDDVPTMYAAVFPIGVYPPSECDKLVGDAQDSAYEDSVVDRLRMAGMEEKFGDDYSRFDFNTNALSVFCFGRIKLDNNLVVTSVKFFDDDEEQVELDDAVAASYRTSKEWMDTVRLALKPCLSGLIGKQVTPNIILEAMRPVEAALAML